MTHPIDYEKLRKRVQVLEENEKSLRPIITHMQYDVYRVKEWSKRVPTWDSILDKEELPVIELETGEVENDDSENILNASNEVD